MIQRVVIDVEAAKVVRFQMPPDQHRSTLCDDVACRGGDWDDVQWSSGRSHVAFVSTSRDHKHEQLRIADAATGAVREVLEEKVPTFFESGNGRVNWRYLPKSNEVIWFSERDNWGHLYLYDLATGKLKNRITTRRGQRHAGCCGSTRRAARCTSSASGRRRAAIRTSAHLYRVGIDGRNSRC